VLDIGDVSIPAPRRCSSVVNRLADFRRRPAHPFARAERTRPPALFHDIKEADR